MLTELAVENFKAFKGRHRVPLAPITLIFGGNSAGKSSLIQALLLLKQTLVGSTGSAFGPRNSDSLVVRGDLVDLGSYRALIHGHDAALTLGLGVATRMPVASRSRRAGMGPYRPSDVSGPLVELLFSQGASPESEEPDIKQVGLGISGDASTVVISGTDVGSDDLHDRFITSVPLSASDTQQVVAWGTQSAIARGLRGPEQAENSEHGSGVLQLNNGLPAGFEFAESESPENISDLRPRGRRPAASLFARAHAADRALIAFQRRLREARADENAKANEIKELEAAVLRAESDRDDAWAQVDARVALPSEAPDRYLEDTSLSIRSVLRNMQYLGPFRAAPERFNVLSGERVLDVGTRGQNVVDLVARRPRLLADANQWLERLEVPYRLEVRAITDQTVAGAIGEVHCLLLHDVRTGVEVSPADVGFGIGQVLPVVVGALTMPGVLCIEQPEIHLHPALQSKLAELFVEARIRGPRGEVERQFILETHSEHLILRFQQLIRHRQLRAEDLCVLHVGFDDGGQSKVQRLRLNEQGEFIDPWPGGFFDERFDLIFGD